MALAPLNFSPSIGSLPAGFRRVDAGDGSIAQDPVDGCDLHQELDQAHVHLIGIRHGQSTSNATAQAAHGSVFSGQTNVQLTDLGKQQAHSAAVQLYDQLGGDAWMEQAAADPEKLPVVYASTLSRAENTAEATVALFSEEAHTLAGHGELTTAQADGVATEMQPHLDPRLMEMGYGSYEMRSSADLQAEQPQFFANWDNKVAKGVDFMDRFPGGGESRSDVMTRVGSFLHDVAQHDPGRTVLAFSHTGTLTMAEVDLGEIPETDGKLQLPAANVPNATPFTLA
jgi:broad specificity phosphatase PhoE